LEVQGYVIDYVANYFKPFVLISLQFQYTSPIFKDKNHPKLLKVFIKINKLFITWGMMPIIQRNSKI
jgi:hypothetical protein